MKRTFYHGTSYANLRKIMREGLKPDTRGKLWTASEDGVYLWSPDALAEAGECEAEWQNDTAKNRAYDSAQCAMAVSKSGKCVVLEIQLDSDEVYEDTSCPNMTGAVVTYSAIPPSAIKSVWVSPDLSTLKGYFIAMVRGNEYFARAFSAIENRIADAFDKAELCLEIDSDFPLQPLRIRRNRS